MSQELMTQSPPAVVDEGGISQLVRLAEQGVAVEVLERLVALQEKVSDRNARMAFVQAMAAFQAEVPPIPKTGEIPDNNGNVRSRFAPLPVIAETIRAPLANHGLSYSWSSVDDDGFVEVTCTVRHVHGHSESASFKCRTTDAAAPKMSGVQMSGSARSYGMRYSLIQALGLTTADEDNDGEGAGVQEVSLRQAEEIDRLLQETGADRTKFFEWAGVKSISEIAAKDFAGVVRALEQKGGAPMILLNCAQGSEAWEQARLGIPTASCFDQILTPKTLMPAASGKYRNKILAEWLLGHPIESFSGGWMERGMALEPKARAYYEMQYDAEVTPVGFILRDDGEAGGSPDGLIGDDGGLEIKVPAPHTHVGYMLDPDSLAFEYRHQCQGNLYLSGRKWWDILAYCPDLPDVRVRVERDEAYIAALDAALGVFVADLNATKERLAPHKLASYATQLAEAIAS